MFWPSDQVTAYAEYAQASTGGPSWPRFPLINESLTQVQPNYPLRQGQLVMDGDGNIFMYVKAGSALAQGNAVMIGANVTGTYITADATGDNIHRLKTNITGITVKNSEVNNWLFGAALGDPQVAHRIKGNTITSGGFTYFDISLKDIRFGRGQFDADATASALANGVVCSLYRPYVVIPTAAIGDVPVGVAMGTVTSGNGTLILVQGMGLVLSDGSVDGAGYRKPLVPNATAGTVKGLHLTTYASDGVELATIIGFSVYAGTLAATLIPAQINCLGRI